MEDLTDFYYWVAMNFIPIVDMPLGSKVEIFGSGEIVTIISHEGGYVLVRCNDNSSKLKLKCRLCRIVK